MHPLYDDTGLSGRQLVIPPDAKRDRPSRLAWAHTLCCYTINTTGTPTGGCITGCTQDGIFEGLRSDQDSDDDSSVNSMLEALLEDESDGDSSVNSMLAAPLEDESDVSIHHFVFAFPNRVTGEGNNWTKAIAERQKYKCWLCGLKDTGTFRITGTLKNEESCHHQIDLF